MGFRRHAAGLRVDLERPNWVCLRLCHHCVFGATKACSRVLDSPAEYLQLQRSQLTGEVVQRHPESRKTALWELEAPTDWCCLYVSRAHPEPTRSPIFS